MCVKIMKLTEVYSGGSGFLKAADITKPTTVTIESYEVFTKDYGDGKGEKSQIILSFVGKEKKLGLNFGNANDLATLIGSDDVDDWIGVTIKLFVKTEKISNEMKDVIRIWPELPEGAMQEQAIAPAANPSLAPDDDGDIPF